MGERLLSGGMLEVGAANAPHVLRAYIHHSSPYARAFVLEQLPRLQVDFISQGTLRVQLLPLRIRKYPQSERQALFVLCAAKQGKGMAMNDALITAEILPETKAAQTALGIDAAAFATCLKSQEMKDQLLAQEAEARQANVTLVPDFFLDNERFTGLPDYPDLRGRIREAMTKF
jgi:protein-disulfide isomerase